MLSDRDTAWSEFYSRVGETHIPALDGIRAIAAFLVVGLHGAYNWVPGRLGVLIFFVLSGFLITTLLLDEFHKTGRISLLHFYKRRALRIFPAFYASWIVALITGWPNVDRLWAITSALYVSNFATAFHKIPMYPSWSLGVEEQFYLLWPCVVMLCASNLKRLLKIALVFVFVSYAWKLLLLFAGASDEYIHCALDTRLGDILCGAILAIVVKIRPQIPSRAFSPWMMLIPFAVIVVAGVCEAVGWPRFNTAVVYTPASLASAVLIGQLIYTTKFLPFAFLDCNAMRYLGRISYSVYLYHGFAINNADSVHFSHYSMRVTAAVVITIIYASASYFLIEKPFLRLRKWLEPKKAAAAAANA